MLFLLFLTAIIEFVNVAYAERLFQGDTEEISCRDREHSAQFASLCAILAAAAPHPSDPSLQMPSVNLINRVSFYKSNEDEPAATLVFVRNPLFGVRARLRWHGSEFQFANAANKLCHAAHKHSVRLSPQSSHHIDYRVANGKDPSCGQELFWLRPLQQHHEENGTVNYQGDLGKDWAKSDIVSAHFGTQRDSIANWEPMTFGMVFSSVADAGAVLRNAFAASPLYYAQPGCWRRCKQRGDAGSRCQCHEFLAVDGAHSSFSDITIVHEALRLLACHDLLLLHHPDVQFMPSFEHGFFRALGSLEAVDARWGVIGFGCGGRAPRYVLGHAEGTFGALQIHTQPPQQSTGDFWFNVSAQSGSCDEFALVIRRRNSLPFDLTHPGFDGFGGTLTTQYEDVNRSTYCVLSALVAHKPLFLENNPAFNWRTQNNRANVAHPQHRVFISSIAHVCQQRKGRDMLGTSYACCSRGPNISVRCD